MPDSLTSWKIMLLASAVSSAACGKLNFSVAADAVAEPNRTTAANVLRPLIKITKWLRLK
jgi:hypothetical protein